MDVDQQQRSRAVERLTTLGGLKTDEAGRLVDAAIAGSIDHIFELVNGSGPVPTTTTTTKANQLRFICDRAGRLLSQREVEILFRVTGSAARTVLTTMLATYEEGLREKFLARMRQDAKVIASGTDESGLTWTVRFSEQGTLNTAWDEVVKLGLSAETEVSSAKRALVLPRTVTVDGQPTDVLRLLGLQKPKK
jgi:hypothetical protein